MKSVFLIAISIVLTIQSASEGSLFRGLLLRDSSPPTGGSEWLTKRKYI